MAQTQPRLWVRGRDRVSACEVDYTRDLVSLRLVERFNDSGTFILELAAGGEAAEAMQPGCGLVVERTGMHPFSGPWESKETVYGAVADSVQVTGIDDTGQLGDRIMRPEQAIPDPMWIFDNNGVVDWIAESALHEHVSFHVGPTARADLRIPGLVMGTDSGRGNVITSLTRLDNLLDVLRDVALRGGGLGFRIVQVGSTLEFQTYMPGNKEGLVVFSREAGTVRSIAVTEHAPSANGVIVGGAGELHLREFAESIDTDSANEWQRIIDVFSDQRGAPDYSTLTEHVIEEREKGAGGLDLKLTLSDTDALRYGRDYGLGDRVTVQTPTLTITGILAEVQTVVDAKGVTVTPIVTTTGVTPRARRTSATGRNLVKLQTSAEGFTRGMVIGWARAIADIPATWQLMDGTNGTPDARNRVLIGAGGIYALLTTGGAASASIGNHSHTTPNHTHTYVHVHDVVGNTIETAPGMTSNTLTTTGGGTHGDTVAIHTHPINLTVSNQSASTTSESGAASTSDSGSHSVATLPPYLAINQIIRL